MFYQGVRFIILDRIKLIKAHWIFYTKILRYLIEFAFFSVKIGVLVFYWVSIQSKHGFYEAFRNISAIYFYRASNDQIATFLRVIFLLQPWISFLLVKLFNKCFNSILLNLHSKHYIIPRPMSCSFDVEFFGQNNTSIYKNMIAQLWEEQLSIHKRIF